MSEITTTLLVRDILILILIYDDYCHDFIKSQLSDNVIFYVGLLLLIVNVTHFEDIFTNLFHSVRYQMTEILLDFISFVVRIFCTE